MKRVSSNYFLHGKSEARKTDVIMDNSTHMALIRKLACLFVTLFLCLPVLAQEEHLTFKGIPITGSISSFMMNLEREGFKLEGGLNNSAMYSGPFAGIDNCIVFFYWTVKTRNVYRVKVSFPELFSSWGTLKSTYIGLKSRFETKYGTPIGFKESFDLPYIEGDGKELDALAAGKATYESAWQVKGGEIILSAIVNSDLKGIIHIDYFDDAGSRIADEEFLEDF